MGAGIISGTNKYKFMLFAGDNEPDTFGISIWKKDEFANETVIYDNVFDQVIAGGSIVIQFTSKASNL